MSTDEQIAEALRFLATLFEPEDVIELRPIPGGGGSQWVTLDTAREALVKLTGALNDETRKTHAYFGANPRKPGGSTLDGVLLARCLFADFDGHTTIEQARIRISDANFPTPTLMMESGGGVHAYWRLSETITEPEVFTNHQKNIAYRLGSDKAVVDFPRIMRLPGFTNWKYSSRPRAVLIESDASRIYDLIEFSPAEPAQLGMSSLSRRLLESGYCLPAGRRQTIFTVACDLHARGWDRARAERELMVRAASLGLDAEALADLPRQIANAFSKPRTPIMDRAEDTQPIVDDTDTEPVGSLVDCIHEWLNRETLPSITTGPWFDLALDGGLKRGQLICFTGPPGVGKSALALQLVITACELNPTIVCAWCLGEMTRTAIAARAIANCSPDDDPVLLTEAINRTSRARKIAISDKIDGVASRIKFIMPPLSFAAMSSVVERSDASILVIDYLQLVNGIDPRADRRTEIDSVLRGVRAMAIQRDMAVIIISNMAKQFERPRIGNMGKESSEIDYQVDAMYLGEMPDDVALSAGMRRIDWRCLKNRHGEPRDFMTAFNGARQQFQIIEKYNQIL